MAQGLPKEMQLRIKTFNKNYFHQHFISIMIKLEINILPICQKKKEFSQSLESIKRDLQKQSFSLHVVEENDRFKIKVEFSSENKFIALLHSKEFHILSGAIKVLCEKSEITIQKNNTIQKWPDIDKVRINFLKPPKIAINS